MAIFRMWSQEILEICPSFPPSLHSSQRIVLSWLILFIAFFSIAGDINRPEVLRNFDVGAARACVFAIDDMTAINKVKSEKMILVPLSPLKVLMAAIVAAITYFTFSITHIAFSSYLLFVTNILLIPYEIRNWVLLWLLLYVLTAPSMSTLSCFHVLSILYTISFPVLVSNCLNITFFFVCISLHVRPWSM